MPFSLEDDNPFTATSVHPSPRGYHPIKTNPKLQNIQESAEPDSYAEDSDHVIISGRKSSCRFSCCLRQILFLLVTIFALHLLPESWKRSLLDLPSTNSDQSLHNSTQTTSDANRIQSQHERITELIVEVARLKASLSSEKTAESRLIEEESANMKLQKKVQQLQELMHESTGGPIVPQGSMTRSEYTQKRVEELSKYECGVFLHFHINKCGGDTLGSWLGKKVHSRRVYKRLYNNPRIHSKNESVISWKSDVDEVNHWLRDDSLWGKKVWGALEIHHGVPGMYYLREYVEEWKKIIEDRGCIFVKTILLRDPLDRYVSNFIFNHVPKRLEEDFIHSRANWLSRYLLYGTCGWFNGTIRCGYDRSRPFTMTTVDINFNEVVHEIKQFDLVGVLAEFDEHKANIRAIAGWSEEGEKTENHRHETADSYSLSRTMMKSFIKENREDYLLYYGVIETYK